jgi:mannan endo-1,4-beta-mannosidase
MTTSHSSCTKVQSHRCCRLRDAALLTALFGLFGCAASDGDNTNTGGTSASSGVAGAGFGGNSASTSPTTGTPSGGTAATSAAGGGATTAAGGTTSQAPADCGERAGFWVDGRTLRDRCCEKVVLRGVNEMVVWSGMKDGTPYFAEIAQTGANVVRIVWNTTGSLAKLEMAIQNAISAQLIPMPELHDATGDLSKLGACVDFWVRSDVVAMLQKYQDKLLINIANEVGDDTVKQTEFAAAYTDAVSRMRAAGLHVPLIIDAPSWGQSINLLQATGPGLIAADPDHNLLFSVHMWWNDPAGTRIIAELDESAKMNLPLIVGEFAQHAVYQCSAAPFAYKTLLAKAKELEVGYLAWSWGGIKNGDCETDGPFDMTTDGTFAGLTDWGLEVAVTDPNSIKNTSVRPRYMTTGSCL